MAKDPAFLFYPNDWLGGTMGMTLEEKGAYIELLILQFNRGHMTKHMIAQTVGQLFGQIKDKFLVDADGKYYNERLEEEQNKRRNYTQSRTNNRTGANQYTKKDEKKVGHMTSHMENENENENIDRNTSENKNENLDITEIEFEKFWNEYDYKVGKNIAYKKYSKLSKSDRESCRAYLTEYVGRTFKNGNYPSRKHPSTFLNNKSWLDELPNIKNAKGKSNIEIGEELASRIAKRNAPNVN